MIPSNPTKEFPHTYRTPASRCKPIANVISNTAPFNICQLYLRQQTRSPLPVYQSTTPL